MTRSASVSSSNSSSDESEASEKHPEYISDAPSASSSSEGENSEAEEARPSPRKRPRLTKTQQERASKRKETRNARKALPLITIPLEENLTPFQRARAFLHVSATPDYLPCRDSEYEEIEAYLDDAICEGAGSCIYVAGVPGTGKTATVRSVVNALQKNGSEFNFLEINGMKLSEPTQAFPTLWQFISGERCAPRQALTQLDSYFKRKDEDRQTLVVLVDELDQLLTKKQEIIYNFFNWPNLPNSKLIVVAIANTMDLPERELSAKVRSRLSANRINFAAYKKSDLVTILEARLAGIEGVFVPASLGLVAARVANVTGDCRRALDVCRRVVELVEMENETKGKNRLVSPNDVQAVFTEMASAGSALQIKKAGMHQKIMLLALSRCIRKLGVADEVIFGDIVRWHSDFCRQVGVHPIPTHSTLFAILASLTAMRLVTTEASSLDYFQKVQACIPDSQLDELLKQDEDKRIKSAASR